MLMQRRHRCKCMRASRPFLCPNQGKMQGSGGRAAALPQLRHRLRMHAGVPVTTEHAMVDVRVARMHPIPIAGPKRLRKNDVAQTARTLYSLSRDSVTAAVRMDHNGRACIRGQLVVECRKRSIEQ